MKKILVVEDRQDVRESAAYVLSAEGFEVETAASGEQALVKIGESPPDVVLLDMGLPGIDGAEVARLLGGSVPIIVLTALPQEGVTSLPGVVGVLPKPAGVDKLLAEIAKVRP